MHKFIHTLIYMCKLIYSYNHNSKPEQLYEVFGYTLQQQDATSLTRCQSQTFAPHTYAKQTRP